MKTTVELITPDMARKYLEKNTHNRKMNEGRINLYAQQIKKGSWKLSGESIKFSKDGKLIDGQHRLNAIIKADKPAQFLICRDLDSSVFDVIDTGKVRSAGDVLSMTGIRYYNTIASMCKFVLLFNKGIYSDRGGNRPGISNNEVLKFVNHKNTEELEEIASYAASVNTRFKFFSTSYIGGLYIIFSEKNQTSADNFFEKYATGIDLSENSPIRLLREKIMKEKASKRKVSIREQIAWFIIAWNHYRTKKPLKQLHFTSKQEFPRPL